jgi:hypothetical protein
MGQLVLMQDSSIGKSLVAHITHMFVAGQGIRVVIMGWAWLRVVIVGWASLHSRLCLLIVGWASLRSRVCFLKMYRQHPLFFFICLKENSVKN